jgi:hypothetical protein
MALESFDTLYCKIKANDGWKPGKLITFTGRQSGKSTFMQQYMTNWAMEPIPLFKRVEHEKLRRDMVMCDVNQEIQDWLMANFEPGKLWKYFTVKDMNGDYPESDRERVVVRNDVYTALVLRWS